MVIEHTFTNKSCTAKLYIYINNIINIYIICINIYILYVLIYIYIICINIYIYIYIYNIRNVEKANELSVYLAL